MTLPNENDASFEARFLAFNEKEETEAVTMTRAYVLAGTSWNDYVFGSTYSWDATVVHTCARMNIRLAASRYRGIFSAKATHR